MAMSVRTVFVLLIIGVALAQENYEAGDEVTLYANKVGPFANPSEQYEYYERLPFCAPEEEERKRHNLGEVLGGDRMVKTPYDLPFLQNFEKKELCNKPLKKSDVEQFQDAIDQDFYFEFIYDDLPVWGFIGETSVDDNNETVYYLFQHYIFNIAYNGDQIVEINWEFDPEMRKDITDVRQTRVGFYYSARWRPSEVEYDDRLNKYQETVSPQHLEIHWFSIFNSFVTVLLLTGFLATILMRVLKNDFTRYAQADDEEADPDGEETGWKLVHGDVFRFPSHPTLFCAVVGNGSQLFALCLGLLILSVLGVFYPSNRGGLFVAALLLFALTSCVAGHASNSLFKKMGGENWVWCTIFTWLLFLGPFFGVATFLNFVAVGYKSSTALPFGTVVVLVLIVTLISFPLTVIGAITGRNYSQPFEAPCRTTKVPRQIPSLPWYRQAASQVLMAGFLPFSAIYIELYYVFAAIWGHKLYTLYGILFLVFIILVIVTSFITIALTYFQLAMEDHQWWWRSIFCGGSTGLFVYGYCIFYYHQRSQMTGFMQGSFFFGYMGLICYGFAMMLGTIGYYSSSTFVKYIYRSIKCD